MREINVLSLFVGNGWTVDAIVHFFKFMKF